MTKKAVVLLSGGLDSAVTLYIAKKDYECSVLIFNYGQRALIETEYAQKLVEYSRDKYYMMDISLPWKGSALLDKTMLIPSGEVSACGSIPDTYVPARNIIFLSFGVSFAEAIGASAVFIGAHQLDFSNYPDCTDVFFESFQKTIDVGTKTGREQGKIEIKTPLLCMTKKEIVETGNRLKVPFQYTWSCYEGGKVSCGKCESCLFREQAFADSGIPDPLGK
ncbi:MAG: 7-cyano-7-deazaguanine synthase QueC [Candidatus Omnitrophota bacterium]